jgi:hypothetical protein
MMYWFINTDHGCVYVRPALRISLPFLSFDITEERLKTLITFS